jgi:hypothetical protein
MVVWLSVLHAGRALLPRNIISLLLMLISVRSRVTPGPRSARTERSNFDAGQWRHTFSFNHSVHMGSVAHPCSMDIGGCFTRVTRLGVSIWPLLQSSRGQAWSYMPISTSCFFASRYSIKPKANFTFPPLITEYHDRLCGLVVRVLGYRSGGPGSIPGTTRKKT